MTSTTLPLPNDFSDRFSPIVVKELRQGLRTRFFTTALILFHSFIILLLGSVTLGAPVETVNGIFWGIAGLMMLVVLPLRAFNALHAEHTAGTLDMLTLTSIPASRIVSGKWAALFSQGLLVAGSLLPYMVARYFFGGVEILREVVALIMLVLGSGVITAALLAFSTQASVILRLLLAVGTGFGAIPLVFFIAFLVSASDADSMLREFFALHLWQQTGIVAEIVGLAAYLTWYLLALGTSRIAPPSENHSTRKRVITLVMHGVLTISGLLLGLFSGDPDNALWCFIPAMVLTLIACMDVMTEEMPRFPTAVATRGKTSAALGRLLHPGWASGVWFATVLCVLTILITGERYLHSHWARDWLPGVVILIAAFVPVSIRLNPRNAFANWWVVQVCMTALGILMVMFCGVMNVREFAFVGVFTPITTLFGAETVQYTSREGLWLAGFGFSLIWLSAALIRAYLNFPAYTALEREARELAEREHPSSHDPAG